MIQIIDKDLTNAQFMNRKTGKQFKATTAILVQHVLNRNMELAMCWILISCIAVALT